MILTHWIDLGSIMVTKYYQWLWWHDHVSTFSGCMFILNCSFIQKKSYIRFYIITINNWLNWVLWYANETTSVVLERMVWMVYWYHLLYYLPSQQANYSWIGDLIVYNIYYHILGSLWIYKNFLKHTSLFIQRLSYSITICWIYGFVL